MAGEKKMKGYVDVEFIVKSGSIEKGTKQQRHLDIAKSLEAKKIVKILGKVEKVVPKHAKD